MKVSKVKKKFAKLLDCSQKKREMNYEYVYNSVISKTCCHHNFLAMKGGGGRGD